MLDKNRLLAQLRLERDELAAAGHEDEARVLNARIFDVRKKADAAVLAERRPAGTA